MLQISDKIGFASRQISAATPTVPGLAGKFFNGDWRSTISTGNIGTLPLTTTNDSSNINLAGSGLPSAAHRYGVNTWPYITYSDLGETYGFIAIGYFTPPTTGTYTIYTSSDDGSGVWIGDLALPGATRTTGNATLNNGMGTGQGNTKRSNTISLTGGVTYPIRIVHEEVNGGDNLTFSWAGPSIAETTDLLTYFKTPANSNGTPTGSYDFVATPSFVQRASPIFTSLTPRLVPSIGNTLITITGSQFVAPMTVSFAGLLAFASNVTISNTTTLTAITPNANTIPGNRQVTISNSLGSATIGGAINFLAPLSSPVAAQAAGVPAGIYEFQDVGMTSPVLMEYEPNYYDGRPFCCVFRSPYNATATTNRIGLNIPMAGLLVQRDTLDLRAAVYWSTPITYNTIGGSGNNTADSGYSPRRVILGGAGGHGIYTTSQDQCSWGEGPGAIGAGFDGGSCGSFPNGLRWGTGQSGSNAYINRSGTWSHWITWGSWPPAGTVSASTLVVGGGGGSAPFSGGGGGGEVRPGTAYLAIESYTIVIGAGGIANTSGPDTGSVGGQGGTTTAFGQSARGGGGGASRVYDGGNYSGTRGGDGSSGGGGSPTEYGIGDYSGGTGFPGFNGGSGGIAWGGGGGGGDTAVGQNAAGSKGGNGGAGRTSTISGASVSYGGGGGGCTYSASGQTVAVGTGGGGNGATGESGTGNATAGANNTGGGAGGGAYATNGGRAGGSGIVIISYATSSMTATGGTITTSGANTIHTFTANGTFTRTA